MELIVRRLQIDFGETPVRWARDDNFSAIVNSGSPIASAFEVYLNKVMARVRKSLPASEAGVRKTIDDFIAQESNHSRVHFAYNKLLFARYPKLAELEQAMAEDFRRQLRDKPLAFNMAYCAGFENLACFMAKFTYARLLPRYEGGDRRVSSLFLWHNAEEYEHRSACSSALAAMTNSYPLRISGFIAFMRHALAYHQRSAAIIFEVDREAMSASEKAESIRYEKAYNREFSRYVFPRMARIFLPFYDPAKLAAPTALTAALKDFEGLALLPEPIRG